MTPSTATGLTASADELAQLLGLIKESDSVELKADRAGVAPALDGGRARDGSARGADPPGLLLRHARPRARQGRASSSAPAGSRARATTRSSSCGPSCRRSCRRTLRRSASFRVEVDALPGGFVCSGTMKGDARPERRARGPQPASGRCGSSSRRSSARSTRAHAPEGVGTGRPVDPRADLRAQAALRAGGARPQARRRDVDLPRRLAHPRALDPVRDRPRRSRSRPSCARSSPGRGVDLSGDQQTKTRKALEYFAKA